MESVLKELKIEFKRPIKLQIDDELAINLAKNLMVIANILN